MQSLKSNLSSSPLFLFEVCPFSVVYKNYQTQSHQDFIWYLLMFMALASIHKFSLWLRTMITLLEKPYEVSPIASSTRLLCKSNTEIKDEGGFFSYCSPELCCTGFPNHTNKNLYMPISKVSLTQETD